MSIIYDSLNIVFNLKQNKQESLHAYTNRFKVACDELVCDTGGPLIFPLCVEKMNGYDANDPDKVRQLQEKAFEQLLAFVFLSNSGKATNDSLLEDLESQFSLGNDQYPKTIDDATNILNYRTHKSRALFARSTW